VITCFTAERWRSLVSSVGSALNQTMSAEEVVIVVDHNDDLLSRVAHRWPDVTVMANCFERGASGARNTGVLRASSPVVAFLDDDAVARPDWLELLVGHFDDDSVVGVGGGVTASWEGCRPVWFPDEFAWVVGASYRGQPEDVAEVRNVWSENMAVRTEKFLTSGGFRRGFGKVGARSRPEDTDLCIRMTLHGGRWLYVPAARVAHYVPASRATFGFFVRRCFAEGAGKAALARLTSSASLRAERDFVRQAVPRAIGRNLREAARGMRFPPAVRAGAMIAGVASAGIGYARGRLSAAASGIPGTAPNASALPAAPKGS
jgi:GT2 family glycosyltransferase